jgi:hypothetical protein
MSFPKDQERIGIAKFDRMANKLIREVPKTLHFPDFGKAMRFDRITSRDLSHLILFAQWRIWSMPGSDKMLNLRPRLSRDSEPQLV